MSLCIGLPLSMSVGHSVCQMRAFQLLRRLETCMLQEFLALDPDSVFMVSLVIPDPVAHGQPYLGCSNCRMPSGHTSNVPFVPSSSPTLNARGVRTGIAFKTTVWVWEEKSNCSGPTRSVGTVMRRCS